MFHAFLTVAPPLIARLSQSHKSSFFSIPLSVGTLQKLCLTVSLLYPLCRLLLANVNDRSFIKLTIPQKYKVCTIFHSSIKIPTNMSTRFLPTPEIKLYFYSEAPCTKRRKQTYFTSSDDSNQTSRAVVLVSHLKLTLKKVRLLILLSLRSNNSYSMI